MFAHVKTTMGTFHETMTLQLVQSALNIKVIVCFFFFLSPVLSGDNTGTSSKKGGDGLWWQEVWKDKDSGDTEHIKTQIRLAQRWWPSPSPCSRTCWGILARVCKPCETVHVSWSLRVCVCPHSVGVPACLYNLTVRNRKTAPINDRRRQTGAEKGGHAFPLLLPENQSNDTALHYTLLLTTGRPCSLRGKEERVAECTTQIIFIWDPGGYWQTGGAFR